MQLQRREWISAVAAGALLARESLGVEGKDVGWLNEVQRRPGKLPSAPPLAPLLPADSPDRAAALKFWKKRREGLRKKWLAFLNPWTKDRGPARAFKVVKEDRLEGVLRQRIRYEAEPGEMVEAYLLQRDKAKPKGPLPGVVAMHSTVNHSIHQPAGVQGKPEKAFGFKLAQRGYVTICPRNFLWPTNDKIEAQAQTRWFHKRHPESKGMAKMLYDAQLAVDILAALPNVDSNRLGCVGHSLGAKEALYLPAFDERIKVSVSSEGGVGTKFSNWNAPWYLGPEIDSPKFTSQHHELLALIAPRAFLLLGGDSADGDRSWPYIEQALSVYRLYDRRPRLGLFNHRQGHAVPPVAERRIYEWIDAYL